MSRFALLAGGGAAATAAAVVAGFVIYQANQAPDQPAPVEPAEPVALVAPEAAPESAPEAAEVPALDADVADAVSDEGAPAAPKFDVVRVEPSGQTLVAGIGPQGARIEILLDGAAVADVAADNAGKFVEFVDLPPSDQPRVLSLAAEVDGARIEGLETIIVAPAQAVAAAAPEEILEAIPEPSPEASPAVVAEVQPGVEDVAEETMAAVAPVREDAPEAQPQAEAAVEVAQADATPETAPTTEVADATPEPDGPLADAPVIAAQDAAEAVAVAPEADADAAEGAAADAVERVADAVEPGADAVVGAVAETETRLELTERAAQVALVAEPEAEASSVAVETAAVAPEPVSETIAPAAAQPEAALDAPTGAPEPKEPVLAAAPETPTVLSATQDGLRVVQAPRVADTIALDTISYDARGDVALAGRGSEGFVRVYLDNTPVTSSRIEADGSWVADLPEVGRGIYTLRVDEVDPSGAVTSRVETPFKREDREALAAQDTGGAGEARVLTVQPGNTLWAIAREKYGQGTLYVRLFEANKDKIGDPNLIYPGQVFDIPE